MSIAHTNLINSIITATKEKPCAITTDFYDRVQIEDPLTFKCLQAGIREKSCIVIPAGYQLAEA